jgi:hypothetical protein
VFLDDKLDTAYTYSVEYHFDPQSPWKAPQYSYRSATRKTENRTLFLNPFDDFAFLDVTIAADGIDTDIVTATDVHLSYTGPTGYSRTDVVTVIAGKEPQHWKLRLQGDPSPQYTYHCVHHLSDGSTITTDPVTTSATTVAVTNPFAGSLDLTFVPLFDPAQVHFAFLDFDYQDPDNHYHRQFRLQFGADASAPVSKHISIRDPKKIGFRYRLTFEGAHGDEERGAFIDTEDTLIAVKKGA